MTRDALHRALRRRRRLPHVLLAPSARLHHGDLFEAPSPASAPIRSKLEDEAWTRAGVDAGVRTSFRASSRSRMSARASSPDARRSTCDAEVGVLFSADAGVTRADAPASVSIRAPAAPIRSAPAKVSSGVPPSFDRPRARIPDVAAEANAPRGPLRNARAPSPASSCSSPFASAGAPTAFSSSASASARTRASSISSDRIGETVAIAVRSAEYRARLPARPARGSRSVRAEELQTQQEELRVANEELEEPSKAVREAQARLEERQEELTTANTRLEEQARDLETARSENRAREGRRARAREPLQVAVPREHVARAAHAAQQLCSFSAKVLAENEGATSRRSRSSFAQTDLLRRATICSTLINDSARPVSKIEGGRRSISTSRPVPVVDAFVERPRAHVPADSPRTSTMQLRNRGAARRARRGRDDGPAAPASRSLK